MLKHKNEILQIRKLVSVTCIESCYVQKELSVK